MTCFPRSALLTSKLFKTITPLPAERFCKTFLPTTIRIETWLWRGGTSPCWSEITPQRKRFWPIHGRENLARAETPKTFYQGRTALARGDTESAQRYFAAATPDFRRTSARRSRCCRASCETRITLRLHAEKGGCPSRSSSSGRTRARKPKRISWRLCGGQSRAGLCTRGRTGPGDHADRASPFHSRAGPRAGSSVEASRSPSFVCAGNGIRCAAIRASRRSSPDRSRRRFIRVIL